jgi:hypothetical protein
MATAPLRLDNIQGNILAGFNKDHQSFLFINFPAGSNPKGWLAQITPDVASTAEVAAFNSLFKRASARRGNEHALKYSWMNLALSASGLHHARRVPCRGGRLAAGPRPCHHHRRQLSEQSIEQTTAVTRLGHPIRLPHFDSP